MHNLNQLQQKKHPNYRKKTKQQQQQQNQQKKKNTSHFKLTAVYRGFDLNKMASVAQLLHSLGFLQVGDA